MSLLRVVRSGPRTTLQDGGRHHHAHLGVPVAGPVDRWAMRAANAAVGNPVDAPVLESTLGGDELEAVGEVTVAVTGATVSVTVDGLAVAPGPVRLRAGQRLRLGRATSGVYVYVAAAGGIISEPVLGSHSRDTLSSLGPPPLQPDDVLTIGELLVAGRVADLPPPTGSEGAIGVRPGPHVALLAAGAFDAFVAAQWTVTPAADRVALRLAGPAVDPGIAGIDSEGLVPGAIQLPPDGQPVLFLANHPVTGGYPLVAVVAAGELSRVAQSRPGAVLRFRAVPGLRAASE